MFLKTQGYLEQKWIEIIGQQDNKARINKLINNQNVTGIK